MEGKEDGECSSDEEEMPLATNEGHADNDEAVASYEDLFGEEHEIDNPDSYENVSDDRSEENNSFTPAVIGYGNLFGEENQIDNPASYENVSDGRSEENNSLTESVDANQILTEDDEEMEDVGSGDMFGSSVPSEGNNSFSNFSEFSFINVESELKENELLEKNGCHFKYRSSLKPLAREEALDFLKKREGVNRRAPDSLAANVAGSQIYIIDRNLFPDSKKMNADMFSSWSETLPGPEERKIRPKWDGDKTGQTRFRKCRATHPRCSLLIKHMFFLMSDVGTIISDILVQYVLKGNELELPYQESNKSTRATPSEMREINDALTNRTTTAAKKFLTQKGVKFNPKTVANAAWKHPDCEKQGTGKRVVTDPEKVAKRVARRPTELFFKFGGTSKVQGKTGQTIIALFPDVIKFFMRSCPTEAEIEKHRERMSELDTLGEEGRKTFVEALLKTRSISQYVPGMGSFVQSDTTFELSHLLVTIVVGTVQNIVNIQSGKSKTVILAVMYHSSKESYHHAELGKVLAECMKKVAPTRRVPSFVTDGEEALKEIAQGTAFENCLHLACDIHCKRNLLHRFGKVEGERLAAQLFGTKKLEDDNVVLHRGVFGAITETEYNKALADLAEKEPALHSWVTKRNKDSFAAHSLRSKLESGFVGHWLTSNIIENVNAQIKIEVKNWRPAEDLIDFFQRKREEVMRELQSAVVGGNTRMRLAPGFETKYRSLAEWAAMSDEQRRAHLDGFGLRYENERIRAVSDVVPSWVLTGKSITERNALLTAVSQLEVDFLPNRNYWHVKPIDRDNRNTIVRPVGNEFCCKRDDCSSNAAETPCCHILAVVLSFPTERRENVLHSLFEKFDARSSKEIVSVGVDALDGGKYAGRNGGVYSAGNQGREMARVSSAINTSQRDALPLEQRRKSAGNKRKATMPLDLDRSFPECFPDEPMIIRSSRSRVVQRRLQYTPSGK